ncbi:MAG: hypothetical protein ACO2O2_09550 [Acidilobaceae archaeon]
MYPRLDDRLLNYRWHATSVTIRFPLGNPELGLGDPAFGSSEK